jgi:glycosyltransferase involved in cell wall biosynthesis
MGSAQDRPEPPRISVIIPAFNRAALLCEAAESALAQSYTNLEVLIVDDGSTDGTAAIVKARFEGDPRVRYLRQEHAGPGPARNLGLRHAGGELIAFLDSDDLWVPDKLALQVRQLDEHPEAALSFSDARNEGGREGDRTRFQGKRFRGDTTLRGIVEREFPMCTPTVVLRRKVLDDLGAFDESFPCSQDWDLWIRVVARYPIVYVDRPLTTIRRSDDSISRTRPLEKWRCWLRLWTKHQALLVRSGCPPRLLRRKLGHAHKKIAQTCRSLGDYEEASAHYLRWWRCQPGQVRGLVAWAALSLARAVGHRGPATRGT